MFVAYPLVLGKRVGRELWPHLAAVLASASFFHVARLSIVAAGYEDFVGALPVVQAALLGVVLAGLLRIEPADSRTLGRLALVAGAVLAFVTVAIPLQFDKQWITIGWALEGAALAWLYRRIPHRGLFWWAIGLLAAVFVRLALNPEVLVYHARSEVPIFNWYLYTYLTCAAATLAAGWMFSTTNDAVAEPLRGSQLAPAAGTVLLFLLLNIEIADFFATGDTIRFNLSAGLGQNLTYTLGWAVFAVGLLAAGIALRSHAARLAAIALLTVAALKGFVRTCEADRPLPGDVAGRPRHLPVAGGRGAAALRDGAQEGGKVGMRTYGGRGRHRPEGDRPAGRRRPTSASAERDDAADQIVRRHTDRDAVARDDLDAEPTHPAAQLGEDFMPRVGLDAIESASVNRCHRALDIEKIVFTQLPPRLAMPVAAAAAEPARPLGPRLGFVDRQAAPAEIVAVHLRDRGLGVRLGRHLDERETARPARRHVADHVHRGHLARGPEQVLQILLRRAEGDVPDVESQSHDCLSPAPSALVLAALRRRTVGEIEGFPSTQL